MLKKIEKLIIVFMIMIGIHLMLPDGATAYPTLQLDIRNGIYDQSTQTIVSSSKAFTLYAYLIPDCKNSLTDKYYISSAVSPQVGSAGANLGTYAVDDQVFEVTQDMTYGVPPLEDIVRLQGWDSGDLAKHGIFPTFFNEFEFSFDPANQITKYNTQDRAISGADINLTHNSNGGMYYMAFEIDTSNLSPEYVMHFDLYNTALKKGGDIDVTQFAPFSHDAQSTQVPEPVTAILLGSGLSGFWFIRRKLNS